MKTEPTNKLTHHLVNLNEIDTSPGPFCMSYGFDLEPLIHSISQVGMVNFPLFLQSEDATGGLAIITGYKRVLALKAVGESRVLCRMLSNADLTPLDCLRINLYDNLTVRSLNPVEKGMVLNRLDPLVSQEEILCQYMPLLGLPSHEETQKLYIAIDRELNETTRRIVAEEQLGIQGLKRLMDLDRDAQTAISDWFTKIKFSINQQIQCIDYLEDLSHIENRSITEILSDDALMAILLDDRANTPQKAKAILRLLREKRLPSVAEADRQFKRQVAGLPLPKGVRIGAPPFFEGPHFNMTIQFRDGRELAHSINKLNTIEDLKALNFPWEDMP